MAGGDAQKGRRIAIIGVSTLLLVAMVVAVTISIKQNQNDVKDDFKDDLADNKKNHVASTLKAVQTICHPTTYKKECVESLVVEAEAGNVTDPKELIKIAFNVTINKIGEKLKETEMFREIEKDPRSKDALDTCKQLMHLSIGEFTRSLDGISEFDLKHMNQILMNLKVWLNGAVTYMDTCLDGFENTTRDASKKMKHLLTSSIHMSSNVLAIVSNFADTVSDMNVSKLFGRRLLQDSEIPSWVEHRILLDAMTNKSKPKPNVTVALDGSGDFKSINEALKKVPGEEDETPFVIYIKAGVYREYVEVLKNMTHIVFVGDGGKKSIITGNKNYMDGVTTYHTTTVGMSLSTHAYM